MWIFIPVFIFLFVFFFNDTATTEIYTLSLHDALPISLEELGGRIGGARRRGEREADKPRSEEHTSELQSLRHLVCRLLLEKKKILRVQAAHGLAIQGQLRHLLFHDQYSFSFRFW